MAEDNYVERLVVGISFKVDKPSEEKAKGALDGLKQAAGELSKALTGVGIVFGTLLAGSIAFSVQQSRLNVQLANEAKSLDTSVERYTALISVFQSFGLEADQITDFLFQLQGQISGAADGSTELVKVFQTMGVAFKDINGNQRTAIDVFFEMADGLKQFGSAGERAAAIQKLLGENGTRLNPIFALGSKRLTELTKSAEESGSALSEEAAAASLELNQRLGALRATTGELARSFSNELIPKLIPLVEQLTEFLRQSDGIVKVGLEKTAKAIGQALEFLESPAGKATLAISGLAVAVGAAKGAASAGSLIGAMGPAGAAIGAFGAELTAVAAPAIALGIVIAGLALVFDDLQVTAEGGDSVLRQLGKTMGDEEGAIQLAKDALDSFSGALQLTIILGRNLIDVFNEIYTAVQPVLGIIGTVNDYTIDLVPNLAMKAVGIDSWDSIKQTASNTSSGYSKAIAYANGDPNITLNRDSSANTGLGSVIGYLADRNRNQILQERWAANPDPEMDAAISSAMKNRYSPGVSINVTTMSKAEIANIAAEQTRKEVNAQLTGIEGLE